jgi:hypothetical protein
MCKQTFRRMQGKVNKNFVGWQVLFSIKVLETV